MEVAATDRANRRPNICGLEKSVYQRLMTIVSSLSSRCLLKLVASRRQHRAFTVLALESSADDTCAAVLTSCRQVLANVVVKQHSVYAFPSFTFPEAFDMYLFLLGMKSSAVYIRQMPLQAIRCVVPVIAEPPSYKQ